MSMQLGFSLSNKKHAGDAQTMPFRECSLAHMENLFKFHRNNVGEIKIQFSPPELLLKNCSSFLKTNPNISADQLPTYICLYVVQFKKCFYIKCSSWDTCVLHTSSQKIFYGAFRIMQTAARIWCMKLIEIVKPFRNGTTALTMCNCIYIPIYIRHIYLLTVIPGLISDELGITFFLHESWVLMKKIIHYANAKQERKKKLAHFAHGGDTCSFSRSRLQNSKEMWWFPISIVGCQVEPGSKWDTL